MIATAIMAEMGNQVGKEPWPSLDWATWIFDQASFLLVISLIVGAISTVAIVWMGIAKEHHWDLARERAGQQIGQLFKHGEQLTKDAEQLRKETAEANARAFEAKLELEKFRAPRTISVAQAEILAEGLKQFAGTRFEFAAGNETEALSLVDAISDILTGIGWVARPSEATIVITRLSRPSVALAAEQGVSIQALPSATNEIAAGRALAVLLTQIGIASRFEWAAPGHSSKQFSPAVLIAVGKKP